MTEESLFAAALEQTNPAERAGFLRRECGCDEALLHRMEALLRVHDHPGDLPLVQDSPTDDDDLIDMTNVDFGSGVEEVPGTMTSAATAHHDDGSTLALGDDRVTETWVGTAAEKPGAVIGPYTLVKKLGEGGMGVVFEAQQDKPVRRKVALKVIKAGMDTRQVVARFNAERQALAIMDHPGIAHVLDAGATDTGRPFFVMELVDGLPITEYCDRNRLSTRQRIELLIPVCQAVQHAHQKGIVHRDLKPSNVLVVDSDGKPSPKVIDFGIAKAIDQNHTEASIFTQQGAIVGTPEYMSPEQAGGAPDVDTRTDVYALGVLLYELLTGSTPLGRDNLRSAGYLEILRMVREEDPPRPSTRLSNSGDRLVSISASRDIEPARISRQMRGELDWIAMKALEKDRSRRYSTPIELTADLRRYLDGDAVLAGPPSRRYRLAKIATKHRAELVTAAAFLVLLVATTAVSAWQAVVATRARRDAEIAKVQSDENRAEAELVSKFLIETFRKPDPGQDGKTLLVVDLLDQAASHLRTEKDVPPRTRVALLATLGETYFGLGLMERSLAVNEEAYRLAEATLGPDHPTTFHIANNLAVGRIARLGMGVGVAQHEAILRRCEAKLGPDHDETIRMCNDLGDIYRDSGNFPGAIVMHERAVRTREARLGRDHPDTLFSRRSLGDDYRAAGRTDEAISLFESTAKACEAKLGANHPETLRCRNGLGVAYRQSRRFDEAIAIHEATLKAREATLGPIHSDTLWSRDSLAEDFLAAGRSDRAIAMNQESLRVIQARLPEDNPRTIYSRQQLAVAYMSVGRATEAIPLLENVLKNREAMYGVDDPTTTRTYGDLTIAYTIAGRFDELIQLHRSRLRAIEGKVGADHSLARAARANLVATYAAAGRFSEAIPMFEVLLEDSEAKSSVFDTAAVNIRKNLVLSYASVGRIGEAFATSEELLKRCEAQFGPVHPITIEAFTNLTFLYANNGRWGDAIAMCEAFFKRYDAQMKSDDLQRLPLLASVASRLQSVGHNDRAEQLWNDALVMAREKLGETNTDTFMIRIMLANLDLIRNQEKAERAFQGLITNLLDKLGPENQATIVAQQAFIETTQSQGRHLAAESMLRDMMARARQKLPPNPVTVGNCLSGLSLCLLRQAKWSEAEECARESIKIREAIDPSDWTTANSRSLLGGALLGQGRLAEAEPLLLAGYELLKLRQPIMPPPAQIRVPEAGERVIQLYEAWGKPVQAASWRVRLHPSNFPENVFAK